MNQEAIEAWAPGPMRDALTEVAMDTVYTSKQSLQLSSIADTEEWIPSRRIREVVPNVNEIEVELITRKTDLNKVNRTLRESVIVGIVLLGTNINRHKKPTFIVLTTKDKLYVIDPDDKQVGLLFFKLKLEDEDLDFWTTNGLNESDCLYHKFGIDLSKAQARVRCCTGIHINIMETLHYLPQSGRFMFPITAIQECRKKSTRIEKFERLVEIWLDIHEDEFKISKAAPKLAHIDKEFTSKRVLNLTAMNVIKQRCILVRPLIIALKDAIQTEVRTMSKNVLTRLTSCTGIVRDVVFEEMRKCEERDQVDIGYFVHLEAGFSQLQR